jgi:predicted Ser/Thr protein kinase
VVTEGAEGRKPSPAALEMHALCIRVGWVYRRTLYFLDAQEKARWIRLLTEASGSLMNRSIHDYYEISKSRLGKGSFGKVYLGRCKTSANKVAIKIIEKIHLSKKNLEVIMNEHWVTEACSSPYVVRPLDVFETHSYIYIVQEYLEGHTLSDFLYHNTIEDVRALTRSMIH